ncbi:ABC transporter substrate-binding protein [Virgisporangium aliadipatigenens]|uniref:ABC transporter substrate-binding protein n=1 Tax=Virgisporangium aliadipatigenens TaxID=741659 RepID=UPI0019429B63|nr:ABC transporter substrate-binding protein [Virgisporangium aliadipatigenens]
MVDNGFRLSIDFGTSNTVAVIRWPDGRTKALLFDGAQLLPSAVYVAEDGNILAGRDAVHSARLHPHRFEPYPKRRIDETTVYLGEREIPSTELIATVLRRVVTEAQRVANTRPTNVTITHPAAWGAQRRDALSRAAVGAGLPAPLLVAEPVAAASYFVGTVGAHLPINGHAVVYDFGAGTFDATVVRRTAGGGFDVLATEGLTDAGGLDVDAAIVGYLGQQLATSAPEEWRRLSQPADDSDRRAAWQLWEDARQAKETLSRAATTYIHVPLVNDSVPLGREQLEQLARPILDRTVTSTQLAVSSAGLNIRQVAAIFLVGGSSRIPLAATLLHRGFGMAPTAIEQPELVVAEGALQLAPRAGRAIVGPGGSIAGGPNPIAPVSGPAGGPVSGPPVSAPPMAVSGPPVSAPPGVRPGIAGPPVSAPPSGYPVSGPPVSGAAPGYGLPGGTPSAYPAQAGSVGTPGSPAVPGHPGYGRPGSPAVPGSPGVVGAGQPGQGGVPGQPGYGAQPGSPAVPGQPGVAGAGGVAGQPGYGGAAGAQGVPGQAGYGAQPGSPAVPGQPTTGGPGGVPAQPGYGAAASAQGMPGQAGYGGAGGAQGIPGQAGYGAQPGSPAVPGQPGYGAAAGAQGVPGQAVAGQPGGVGQAGYGGQGGAAGAPGQAGVSAQPGAAGQPGVGAPGAAGVGQYGQPGIPAQGAGQSEATVQIGAFGQPGVPGQPGYPGGQPAIPGQPSAADQSGAFGQPGAGGQGGVTGAAAQPGVGPAGGAGQPGALGQTGGQPAGVGQQGSAGQPGVIGQAGGVGQQGVGQQGGVGGQAGGAGAAGVAGQPGAVPTGGVPGVPAQGGAPQTGAMAAPGQPAQGLTPGFPTWPQQGQQGIDPTTGQHIVIPMPAGPYAAGQIGPQVTGPQVTGPQVTGAHAMGPQISGPPIPGQQVSGAPVLGQQVGGQPIPGQQPITGQQPTVPVPGQTTGPQGVSAVGPGGPLRPVSGPAGGVPVSGPAGVVSGAATGAVPTHPFARTGVTGAVPVQSGPATANWPAGAPGGPAVPPERGRSRGKLWAGVTAGVVVLALLIGGGIYLSRDPDPKKPGPSVPVAASPACGYKIAYLGVLSGDAKADSEAARNGVQMAIDKFNREHSGCAASLQEFDTKGEAETAARLANEITADPKILGVVGPFWLDEAERVLPILDAAGIPVISPALSMSEFSGKYKSFHRTVASDADQNEAAVRYLLNDFRARKVFVVADKDDRTLDMAAEARLKLNTAFVGRADIETNQTDFGGIVNQITSATADAVYYLGYSVAGGEFVKQVRAARKDIKIIGWDRIFRSSFVEKAGKENAEGVVITCPCVPPSEAGENFGEDYKKRFNATGYNAPEAYDAANVLLNAMAAGKATRADVESYVDSYDKAGVSHRIKFTDKGDLDATTSTVWAFKVKDGQINGEKLIAK